MPRLPRFFVPDVPLHVIQRGNGRGAIFRDPSDFLFFRDCLGYAARRHSVAIHAYVFMTNHVHLLATPADAGGMPKMVQSVGRVYVPYFNKVYGRAGGLWESRYKATLVDDENDLLTCMRYIELNPVRAGMVDRAADYPWSSFRANAFGARDPLVTPHPVYERFGGTRDARQAAYRGLFAAPVTEADLRLIRDATQHAWVLGSATFRERVVGLGRRPARLPIGRPRSVADATKTRV